MRSALTESTWLWYTLYVYCTIHDYETEFQMDDLSDPVRPELLRDLGFLRRGVLRHLPPPRRLRARQHEGRRLHAVHPGG